MLSSIGSAGLHAVPRAGLFLEYMRDRLEVFDRYFIEENEYLDLGEYVVLVGRVAAAAGRAVPKPPARMHGSNLPVRGVPDGKAVKQAPMGVANGPPGLPPGAKVPAGLGAPTRYLVEFTVGPYLYFAHTEGDSKTAPRFVAITKRYYEQVKDL